MTEVFRPQMMYSLDETRQIFIKLAHSSIMRLNETSMQKLFDLMLMGMKMQTIQSCFNEEILHVTVTHLDNMAKMIDQGTDAQNYLVECKQRFVDLMHQFNAYDFMIVKQ